MDATNRDVDAMTVIVVFHLYRQTIEAIETDTLPELVQRCTGQITGLVYLVQGDLDPGNRVTVEALIVLDVHGKLRLCEVDNKMKVKLLACQVYKNKVCDILTSDPSTHLSFAVVD